MPLQRKVIPALLIFVFPALHFSAYALEQSVSPVAGYSPTYSLALGGAYFFRGESFSGRLVALYTLSNAFQLQPRLEARITPWSQWETDVTVQKGFEPYYGEGSQTSVADRKDYPAYHSESATGARFELNDHFSLAPRFGLRTYRTIDQGPNPINPAGDGVTSPALGLDLRWDYRGKGKKHDEGFFQETEVWWSPGWSGEKPGAFGTGETRFTEGVTLFSEVRLVFSADLGGTLGDSDYAYRFRLGGTCKLRGYLDNRFRGKYFYLQATELRIPLTEMFSLGAFTEVGDTFDDLNGLHPKGDYGAGLRIALPPDRIQWARLDAGFGQDSWAMNVDFGLPF